VGINSPIKKSFLGKKKRGVINRGDWKTQFWGFPQRLKGGKKGGEWGQLPYGRGEERRLCFTPRVENFGPGEKIRQGG